MRRPSVTRGTGRLAGLLAGPLIMASLPLDARAAEGPTIPLCGGALWGAPPLPSGTATGTIETYVGPADGNGVTFLVEYLDVTNATGLGFDDPKDGGARRAVFEAVTSYLAGVLDHDGSALIVVLASQTDGTGALGVGVPLADFATPGCRQGYVFEHLTVGVDPDRAVPDAYMGIDFGYSLHASLDPPAPDEIDLYSVLLHEMTHALGFVSTLTVEGLGPTQQNPDVRAVGFDGYLQTADGAPLIACPEGLFIATTDVLVGPPSVRHAGPRTGTAWRSLGHADLPPVHTPSVWAPGSSLMHWDAADQRVPDEAVMRTGVDPGETRRVYTSLDLAALEDLGYALVAGPGCPADLNMSGSVSFADLVAVLTQWGPCRGCPEDLDESGEVEFADLLVVLLAWGPCR